MQCGRLLQAGNVSRLNMADAWILRVNLNMVPPILQLVEGDGGGGIPNTQSIFLSRINISGKHQSA